MSATKQVLDRLDGVRETKSGWSARCPAHEDRNASLSISEGNEGRVLLKCHAGCDHKKIVESLGLVERDLFDADATRPAATKKAATPKADKKGSKAYATADAAQKAYERQYGKPATVHEYLDESGVHVGSVIRWQRPRADKVIRPTSLHADGWRLEHMPEPRPLLDRRRIVETAARVYVVEGEKCVDAASGLGLVATTSVGGSNAASKSDWSPLAGREVVILPDADESGRKYADEVAAILLALSPPAVVRIVELFPGSDDGSDVADLLREELTGVSDPELREEAKKSLHDTIAKHAAATEPLKPKGATASTTPATPKATSTSTPVEAWQPFPTDALPEAAATLVVEAARAIGCDEAFVALPMLAVLGSAIGTTRRVMLKPDWTALPIVWPVTVAESGSHKSPAADVSLDYVRDREATLYEEYLAELDDHELAVEAYEKARAAWRSSKASDVEPPRKPAEPRGQRAMVEDATVEAIVAALADNPRGLLVATDELTSWLNNFDRYAGGAGGDEAFFLKSYSGRSHNVLRRTGGRRTIHVKQAALWVTGTIQPGTLRRSLGIERRESGFLARLLLAAPPRRAKKWSTDSVGFFTRENFKAVLDRLYALTPEVENDQPRSKVVRLDRDAEELFKEFFLKHDEEAQQLVGDLAAAWSKLEEVAGRLALVIHETRLASGEAIVADMVNGDTMARAIRLTGFFKHETRRLYAMLVETDEERSVRQADDRLVTWIVRHGGTASARDVLGGCHRWLATSEEVEVALKRLVDAGRGHWLDKPAGERGGRPTRLFVLDQPAAVEEAKNTPPPSAQPRREAVKTGCGSADAVDAVEAEEVVEI